MLRVSRGKSRGAVWVRCGGKGWEGQRREGHLRGWGDGFTSRDPRAPVAAARYGLRCAAAALRARWRPWATQVALVVRSFLFFASTAAPTRRSRHCNGTAPTRQRGAIVTRPAVRPPTALPPQPTAPVHSSGQFRTCSLTSLFSGSLSKPATASPPPSPLLGGATTCPSHNTSTVLNVTWHPAGPLELVMFGMLILRVTGP